MTNWQDTIIPPSTPILEAIRILDQTAIQICLVVDGDGRLMGTVTDGDVRRGILRGLQLTESVTKVMNQKPQTSRPEETREDRLRKMAALSIRQIPVIDARGLVVGLDVSDSLLLPGNSRSNWVLLMAGGLGKRLQPLTATTPKPLLEVGGKPILETIVENFVTQGFCRFYISVNYKAGMVKQHFGDGGRWGADIRYLDEDTPLGTAGPMGLIPQPLTDPLLVMNGDLLTKINFDPLLAYHNDNDAAATMCVREYDFQVPFGVVNLEGDNIRDIEEKPCHRFFVNAGIYVLAPSILNLVSRGQYLDMPDFFRLIVGQGKKTIGFPIREYWVDIGRLDDLDQANQDFSREFEQ